MGRAAGAHVGPAVVEPRYEYPPEVRERFLRNCTSTSGGQREVCRCTLGYLQRTMPYDEFDKADRALREGRTLDRAVMGRFDQATSACRDSE